MQDTKECYFTHSKANLHLHHIFAGSNRKNSDKWGCTVYLRADFHNMSSYGVHFNKELDLQLKRECQKRFEEKYSHEKFMEIFKKNYL